MNNTTREKETTDRMSSYSWENFLISLATEPERCGRDSAAGEEGEREATEEEELSTGSGELFLSEACAGGAADRGTADACEEAAPSSAAEDGDGESEECCFCPSASPSGVVLRALRVASRLRSSASFFCCSSFWRSFSIQSIILRADSERPAPVLCTFSVAF